MALVAHDIWSAWRAQAERRRKVAAILGMRLPALTVLMDRIQPDPAVRLVDGSSPEGPAAAWLERRGYLVRIGMQARGSAQVPIRIVTEDGLTMAAKARELGW